MKINSNVNVSLQSILIKIGFLSNGDGLQFDFGKCIWKYSNCGWGDDNMGYVHPKMKILPPIVWDMFAVIFVFGVFII